MASPRPGSDDAPSAKRLKTTHAPTPDRTQFAQYFASGLLEDASVNRLNSTYRQSGPFLHAVVDELFQDDLLTEVKDECIGELSFAEKETDIYKVHQTGDLASLSYLAEAQIALLPNLLKLRDALYSDTFRSFLRRVTGCGPLSGKKQDMSVNSYKKGCHLLNHDDVIGTRRVSYILYMPLPKTEEWKIEWGGALELYPVKPGPDGSEEPEPMPSKTILPSWNQFVLFEVHPGHSFHSVEEVTVDEGDCQRQRLSISGWFHKAQEDEEGYEIELVEKNKSSLEQLTSAKPSYTTYPDVMKSLEAETGVFSPLTKEEISFLSAFLDPVYLQPKLINALSERFVEDSSLELHKFLCEPLASKLEKALLARDKDDGLDGESRKGCIPPHTSGLDGHTAWTLCGPPHKFRYCTLPSSSVVPADDTSALSINSSSDSTLEQIMLVLQTTLFSSMAFRSWLKGIARLFPLKHNVKARRFRPGLDYTLATSNNYDATLDVVLGLTPEAGGAKNREESEKSAKAKEKKRAKEEEDVVDWGKGEWGGWECYIAPHEGDDDPAVYRSGSSGTKAVMEPERRHTDDSASSSTAKGPSSLANADEISATAEGNDARDGNENEDEEMASFEGSISENDEDDGTLLTVQPGFNRLMLVLRDEGVLRFVKYVSADAPGSRWDVCGEYDVLMPKETEDNIDEENGV